MGDLTDSVTAPQPAIDSPAVQNPRPAPARDDCWSEEATFTLIEAWGRQFLGVNRGSLRQKHWQEVSDAVNGRHAQLNNKAFRTDVQCKNRIDTLKKKYKVEKARVLDSDGNYRSNWPYFGLLDPLIGSPHSGIKNPSPATPSSSSLFPPSSSVAMLAHQFSGAGAEPPMAIPLLPHGRTPPPATAVAVFSQKRPSPVAAPLAAEFSNIRNNYSTVAAAAAAAAETDEDEDEEDLDDPSAKGEQNQAEGLRKLATAIERFGKVYARIEEEKQKQMVELEKQRMQFTKELECQRMQMLVEMQVQLEKVKRVKRSH